MTTKFCSDDNMMAALTTALGGNETLASTFCTNLDNLAEGTNTFFLVILGALVFLMHAGFAMLCAGSVRTKNTMNILLQTVMDAAVSAIMFYLLGYGFAYGRKDPDTPSNGFIGNWGFGLKDQTTFVGPSGSPGRWSDWFYQWAFAATAVTIPAGAVAERFNFVGYIVYSFVIATWIYPVVVHWVWSADGWLGKFNTVNPLFGSGMIDFAGSSVVHMVGGFSGLMGCILVGPRLGRFDSAGKAVDMPGHSATLVVLGVTLLWFGWYGFNPGSTLNVTSQASYLTSGRAAVTTTLAGSAAALTGLLLSFFRHSAWDLIAVTNGALVGFVVITAGCSVLEPWAAILGGATGMVIFELACDLWLKLRIDDPLLASPMHGVCGAWGVFIVGLVARPEYVVEAYPNMHYGLFYGGGGRLLACQVIGILVIFFWVTVQMGIVFFILKMFRLLRISPEDEQAGLDMSKHGGSAYNYEHGIDKVPGTGKGEIKV